MINSTKIICKKIPKVLNNTSYQRDLIHNFHLYNQELTKGVNKFIGFRSSESYYNSYVNDIHDNHIDCILTLSNWDKYYYWNNWYTSEERNEIKEKYSHILEDEKVYVIKREGYFLL